MATILCVGIATLDIVNEVAAYPVEDDEIRILSQNKRRGGNATNTAVILSQLGHQCYWAGTLAREIDSQTIKDDLNQFGINQNYCQIFDQGKVPTSYITVSQANGSRTICHYRDLPEYSFEHFKTNALSQFDWIHFEGRNVEETQQMMRYCRQKYPDIPISIEIEKNRDAIESLIPLSRVILFSRQYALSQGFIDAQQFCQQQSQDYPDKIITCAWGELGAGASQQQKFYWQNATNIESVETLGAGDVFNAAIIDQLLAHSPLNIGLSYACELAALKCTQKGLRLSHLKNLKKIPKQGIF